MSFSRLDSFLSTLISLLFALLLFFLPLLFSMKSSEVFEFPKMLFVYTMTVLIVACWISRMIVNRKIIYTKTPLDIPIFFFLLSQLLSTLFSIDTHTSFFGYYSRWNGGLLSTIAYTLLYVGYVSNSRLQTTDYRLQPKKSHVSSGDAVVRSPLAVSAIVASATMVSIYAIFQRLGIDKDFWVQDVVSRVFSTQGQPNWLAAYLVMVLPLTFAMGVTSDKPSSRATQAEGLQATSMKKYFWLVPCSLFLVALFFTRSRSGLLGFVVTDLTFWSVTVWNYMLHQRSSEQQPTFSVSKNQYRLKTIVHHLYSFRLTQGGRLFFSFVAIHSLILVLVLLTNNPAREWLLERQRLQTTDYRLQSSDSSSLPPTPYSLSPDSITPSSDIRRIVWTGALQLVKERPWFGWGPETFAFTYWKVRPIAHNMTSEWNFLYNKAHNEWLNLAANTGLFSLGTHLLLLGWFTGWCLKKLQATGENQRELVTCRLLLVATISALLGAEIVNFFGFSTVTTQAYSYIFMGIAVIAGMKDEGQRTKETTNGLRVARNELRIPFIVYCLLFIVSLSAIYLLSQISISFLADLSYNRGKQFANAGYVQDALADLESAVGLIPDEPVFRSELAETQGVLAVSLSLQDEEHAAAFSLKDSSLMNFRIVGKQSPANVSFLRIRARVTYALGSLDPSLYDEGIELMERTMDLAPTDPKILYNLGVMLQDRGRTDDAKGMFKKALDLKPDYEEAKQALSSTNLPH